MGFNPLFLPLFLQTFILIEFLPLSTPILASSGFSIAKPGCDDRCGNLSIPFPFGTKEGCYFNRDFFINCSDSANNAPQPLLRRGNVTVTNISLKGQLRLLQIPGRDCYYQNGTRKWRNSPRMWLAKGLTFNSTANKFTTVGCDTYSFVAGVTVGKSIYETGCVSFCAHKEDVKDGPCSGIGCCQTSIPPGAWKINVSMTSYRNHTHVWNFNPCSYAFVVEDGAFQFFADNLTNLDKVKMLPVVVDWIVDNITCKAAQKNTTSYACSSTNSRCEELKGLGYRCLCKEGYEGNPYLPGGCQDIDECKDIRYRCAKNSACSNTFGSYRCPCRNLYHGDGREGEGGCSPNWSIIVPGQSTFENDWRTK